jgi:hypothetical protein
MTMSHRLLHLAFVAPLTGFPLAFLACSSAAAVAPATQAGGNQAGAATQALPGELRQAMLRGQYAAALKLLDERLQAAPAQADLWLLARGLTLSLDKRPKEALAAFDEFLARFGGEGASTPSVWVHKVRFHRAEVLRQLGRHEEAEQVWETQTLRIRSSARQSELAAIYFDLADGLSTPAAKTSAESKRVDYGAAYELYAKVLELDAPPADRARSLSRMGVCREALQDFANCAVECQRFLDEFDPARPSRAAAPRAPTPPSLLPQIMEVRLRHGRARIRTAEFAHARALLEDLAEDVRGSREGRGPYAELFAQQDQATRAKLARLEGDARFELGQAFPENDVTQALVRSGAYRRFLEADPSHPKSAEALAKVAALARAAGRSQEALKALDELAVLPAGQEWTGEEREADAVQRRTGLFTRGVVLQEQRRFDEAAATFTEYGARYPSGPEWSAAQAALVELELQRADDALEHGRFEDARKAWARFLLAHPLDPRAISVGLRSAGSLADEAERLLAEAELEKRTAEVRPRAEELLLRSIDDLRRLAERYPAAPEAGAALLRVGEILETQLRDVEAAVTAYKQCTVEPSASEARARLARMVEPALAIRTERSWRASERPRIKVQARNLEKLEVELWALNVETYFRKHLTHGGVDALDLDLIAPDQKFERTLEGYRRYEPLEREIDLPVQGPGTWVVAVTGKDLRATTLVISSDVDLISKTSAHELFVFAQDQASGKPADGVRVVAAVPSEDGQVRFVEFSTGADGTGRIALDPPCPGGDAGLLGLRGGHVACAGLELGALALAEPLVARGLVYTDRPVYRPGQRAHWRAIVREAQGGRESFEAGSSYPVELSDPSGRVLERTTLPLSEFGTLTGTWNLEPTSPVGAYSIAVRSPKGGVFSGTFQVELYQLEKVDLTLSIPRPVVQRGEEVELELLAAYYYGEPVADSPVQLGLPDGSVAELRTDGEGRLRHRFATRDLAHEGELSFSAVLLEHGVSRAGRVYLAQSEFQLQLEASRSAVLAGDGLEARLFARSVAGEPLGRTFTLQVLQRRSTAWGTWSEVEVSKSEIATDPQTGRAAAPVRLERGGHYLLRAQATDRFGNPISAEAAVVASGEEDELRLRLLAEDTSLPVGSRARVKIVNRSGPGLALLTLESDGVLEHRLLTLADGTSEVELELGSQTYPRAFVAIARMAGNRFHAHAVAFDVERELRVTIESSAETYEPGGVAKLRVRAVDPLGVPVRAELSLAVVDESLFDRFPDQIPALASYFQRTARSREQVHTVSSCTFAYAGSTARIAAEVLQTAAEELAQQEWDARKEVALRALEYSGSADAPAGGPSPASEAVQDSLSLGMVLGKRAGGRQALRGAAGIGLAGGAGGDADAAEPLPELETAFWTATLVTDAEGRAEVEFELPGQSTSWRATCRGITTQTLGGQATASFRSRSEFFLELVAPVELIQGDRPRFLARVHNATGLRGPCELVLAGKLGGASFRLPQRVELGEAKLVEVLFPLIDALEAAGQLDLTLQATATLGGKERGSGTQRSVPVRDFGLEGFATRAGVLSSAQTLQLELERGRSWQHRSLELFVGPGLERTLVAEALGELGFISLRAGCLPPFTLADAAAELYGASSVIELMRSTNRGARPEHEALLAKARARVSELVAAQNGGGWPWIVGPRTDPSLGTSCLATAALRRAQLVGLYVPAGALESAAGFLQQQFRGLSQTSDEEKAMIQWALACTGNGDFAAANRLHRERGSLSSAALAYTALALVELERAPMAAEVAETLAQKAQTGPGGEARVGGSGNLNWNSSTTETTALTAYVLGRALESSPLLPQLIQALLADRPWNPVRAKGFALAALAWHAQRTAPREARSSVTVKVAGLPDRTIDLEPDRAGQSVRFDLAESAPAKLRVDLELSGGGRPDFVAVLRGVTKDTRPMEHRSIEVYRHGFHAPPPVHRGREIDTGFGVVTRFQRWENMVAHLPLGRTAEYQITHRVNRDTHEYLVLELPLPAGTRVLEDSLQRYGYPYRREGTRLFVFPGASYGSNTLGLRILAALPGQYRTLPVVVHNAHDPSMRASGEPLTLEVLARGEKSSDPYRPTPDELFYLGKSHYEAGERAQAHALLAKLFAEFESKLRDDPLREGAEMLLYLSIEREEPREVVRYFEILKEKNPDLTIRFESILAVGAAYRQIGEHERALLIFRAIVEQTFGKDLRVVAALEQAQDDDASLRAMSRLVNEYADFPTVLEAELTLSDRLLLLAPKAHENEGLRKHARDRASLTAEGIQILQRFLLLHPRDPLAAEAGLNLVNAFLSIDDYARCTSLGRELAEVFQEPRYADAFLYAAAVADWYRGEDEAAMALLQRIADAKYVEDGVERPSPNRDLAVYILAQIHHAKQRFGQASEYYERVDELFADAREALLELREKRVGLPEITSVRPGTKAAVKLTYRNLTAVELAVFPVDLMTLYLREKNLSDVAGIELAGISPTQRLDLTLGGEPNMLPKERTVDLSLEKPGAYLIIARGDEQHASGLVLVSDLELEVREDAEIGRLRVQARRTSDASFLRNVEVRVVGSQSGTIQSGKTDPRGLFVTDGVVGTSTVIAELDGSHYAFFRGTQALGDVPRRRGKRTEAQLGEKAGDYFQNVYELNRAAQQERGQRLKDEIGRERKGVQIRQVK